MVGRIPKYAMLRGAYPNSGESRALLDRTGSAMSTALPYSVTPAVWMVLTRAATR